MPDDALGRGHRQCCSKVGGSSGLGEVGVGPAIDGGRDRRGVMAERADHDTGPRRHPTEGIDRVEADLEGHLDLEDDNLRTAPIHQLDGRRPAVRLGDLRRLEAMLQQPAHYLAPLVPVKTQHNLPQRVSTGKPMPTPHPPPAANPPQPKAWWPRLAALLVLLLAGTSIVFLAVKRPEGQSIRITLMDTTSPRGIYDDDNRGSGRSNSKELYEFFKRELKEIAPENIDEQSVGLNWDRRNQVRLHRPDLLIIHRSVFFHPVAAHLGFLYPEEIKTNFLDKATRDAELEQFDKRYKTLGDDPLRGFLGDIGDAVPRTKFLVYSRGTDRNWLSASFRVEWVKSLEQQYPALKGRVTTMLIEPELLDGKKNSSFRNPKTRDDLLKLVRTILELPEKRKP